MKDDDIMNPSNPKDLADMRRPSQEVLDAMNEDLTDAKRYSDTKELWKDLGIDPTANSKK